MVSRTRVFGETARTDMMMLQTRVWEPALAEWMDAEGQRIASRMRSRSRRTARTVTVWPLFETRNVDPATKRSAARRLADAILGDVAERRSLVGDYAAVAARLLKPTVASAVSAVIASHQVPANPAVYASVLGRSSRWNEPAIAAVWDHMVGSLADGILAGDGVPALADRLRASMAPGSTRAQATMIARTEVVSAYNGSVAEMARAYGPDVAGGLEWIATNDERTRPSHVDADGQIVDVGGRFTVGGDSLEYPGDPSGSDEEVINCRCATAVVVPEDMPGAGARVATHDALVALFAVALGRVHPVVAVEALRRHSTVGDRP